jgi:prepilin-type N-terminal cleavage/methylation domain-containing protein/prepilin-type processing-associated H-X9-DG protein
VEFTMRRPLSPWRCICTRDAFTLIELLVVIAVIALLIGILVPSLASARRAAMATRCLSNIRQLEMAQVLYANDHREYLVDAGLAHGGINSVNEAWPVQLAEYGASGVIRSPIDRSRYWPISEGGQDEGLPFGRVLELVQAGEPVQGQVARWTSYGLNNFTTRSVLPSITPQPGSGASARGPWDRLSRIPRPHATVHFLMMTFGTLGDPGGFARADHVHAEDWHLLGEQNAPAAASGQMEIAAHGGKMRTAGAQANYGFLDGSARTLRFSDVYRGQLDNRFYPEVAR